jgi:ribokinase
MGAQGALIVSNHRWFHQPAVPVTVIDTVAAGDAFNGGLAVGLSEGMDWTAAVKLATAAAAWSVTQPGAQSAMPDRHQVQTLLEAVPEPIFGEG